MSGEEAVEWLRGRITQRLEAAKAAAATAPPPWKAADHESDSWIVTDATGEPLIYDEGTPSLDEARHIALNDPQDVIARCEAELAILQLYTDTATIVADATDRLRAALGAPAGTVASTIANRDYIDGGRELPVLAEVVRLAAGGYRHRPGYAEHWGGERDSCAPAAQAGQSPRGDAG